MHALLMYTMEYMLKVMFSSIRAQENGAHNGKKVEQRENPQGERGRRKGTDERQ